MDQVTQQNAAMVEQSTAASHALAGEAEQLTALAGRFKVSGAPAAQARRAAPARAAAKPAVQLKTAGGRGASAALAPATDWEEF